MKKALFSFLIFISFVTQAFCQTEGLQKTIRATNIQETLINRPNFVGGNMVYGIPDEPKRVLGNFYLDPKWNKSTLMLYKNDQILTDHLVRYNIESHQFEAIAPNSDQVKTIPGLRVHNLVWIDSVHQVPRYFVNGMEFLDQGVPISGFFEILVDGELPLVRRTVTTLKRANYNTALMIGNKDDEIKKKNIYYFVKDKQVLEVPRKKKKLLKIFDDKEQEVEGFIDANRINLGENNGLYKVFSFYNSLYEGYEPLWPEATE
ncbi:hypothetical protein KI659_08725 [Litoribacter alkaliphilus]|uniref:Uncharacterized protein n=1 Tax=Litoribacter ruber TaxID=702568 RepID=A0AAP2CHU5_9BACT|nr:hypothetical protein [Litoribacter alkaliphilus]MBS9524095.1 hypothetical protein [Litoribacter alkaliphilus]